MDRPFRGWLLLRGNRNLERFGRCHRCCSSSHHHIGKRRSQIFSSIQNPSRGTPGPAAFMHMRSRLPPDRPLSTRSAAGRLGAAPQKNAVRVLGKDNTSRSPDPHTAPVYTVLRPLPRRGPDLPPHTHTDVILLCRGALHLPGRPTTPFCSCYG